MLEAPFNHQQDLYHPYWYHPDHLGSSSYITNLAGEINQHMEYLPFGETLVEEHLNSNNAPYKFNAKEFDAETGNYYYGARYYNPKWSIWLSVDPLAEKYPGWSPYNYTLQNPVRFTDPTGMSVEGSEWEPDGCGNLISEENDNAETLATYLNTTEENAQSMIDEQGLVTEDNGNVKKDQVLNLNNNMTRSMDNSNGTLTTDDYLNYLETGYSDFTIGSNDKYNCFGCSLSATQGEEINNQNSLMTDPLAMERILNNNYQKVDPKNAVFGKTIISMGSGGVLSHSAVYYGSSKDGTIYVYTKNGMQMKPEIMSLDNLIQKSNSTTLPKNERYGEVKGFYNYNN